MKCEVCDGSGTVRPGDDWGPLPCAACMRRAAAVPVGEWSAEPPTVPGWYWWRDAGAGISERVVKVIEDDGHRIAVKCGGLFVTATSMRGEWWSIPIQSPGV